jgi:Mitochondrial carrier protein
MNKSTNMSIFISGCFGGAVNSFFVTPIEYFRTHQILISGKIKSQQTLSRIYRCLIPTILRDSPGMGFYLLSFHVINSYNSTDALLIKIAAGGASGVSFWLWALPIDTFKTTLESTLHLHETSTASQHIVSSMKAIAKENAMETLRYLYKPLPYALLRGIPSAAITLSSYDILLRQLLVVR